jgi:hypothetical protein
MIDAFVARNTSTLPRSLPRSRANRNVNGDTFVPAGSNHTNPVYAA